MESTPRLQKYTSTFVGTLPPPQAATTDSESPLLTYVKTFCHALKMDDQEMKVEVVTELKSKMATAWSPIEVIPLGKHTGDDDILGNTNVGKSTLLAKVTGMFGLLNTSINRETSCLWRYRIGGGQGYALKEVPTGGGNAERKEYASREEVVKAIK